MFQYFSSFFRYVSPFSIASMASSSCWSIHLAYFEVLICLLPLPWPCIVVLVRWHCCCIMLVVSIACCPCYVVGVACWRSMLIFLEFTISTLKFIVPLFWHIKM
jgi:hypothetical protein